MISPYSGRPQQSVRAKPCIFLSRSPLPTPGSWALPQGALFLRLAHERRRDAPGRARAGARAHDRDRAVRRRAAAPQPLPQPGVPGERGAGARAPRRRPRLCDLRRRPGPCVLCRAGLPPLARPHERKPWPGSLWRTGRPYASAGPRAAASSVSAALWGAAARTLAARLAACVAVTECSERNDPALRGGVTSLAALSSWSWFQGRSVERRSAKRPVCSAWHVII